MLTLPLFRLRCSFSFLLFISSLASVDNGIFFCLMYCLTRFSETKQSAYDAKLKAASLDNCSTQSVTFSLFVDPFERPYSFETAPYKPSDALSFFVSLSLSGSPSSRCLIRHSSQSSTILRIVFRNVSKNLVYFGSSATIPSRLLVNLSVASSKPSKCTWP